MNLIVQQLLKFVHLLHSETGTRQISWGLSLGLVMGFSPFLSLQTFLVLLMIFFLRIQMGAAFLSAAFFKFVAFLADPIAEPLGRWALELEAMRPLYVTLYNMPIVPMTRFNDSMVMGSGLLGFILVIPGYFLFKYLVVTYRETVVRRVKASYIWRMLTATKLYRAYEKYLELYG